VPWGTSRLIGVHLNERDLYTLVLKAHEVRLLVAIAAERGATVYKYDTSQAFLYGDRDEELYARAPDWWPMTDGTPIESFLGLEVEQGDEGISLHLDTYVKELIEEYKLIHRKFVKPKTLPMQPAVVLESTDCPELPDPVAEAIPLNGG
jgi:hypothetical protein